MQSWIHVLEWRALISGDQPAVTDGYGEHLTYRQLLTAVEDRAGQLVAAGLVTPDGIVAVLAKNSARYLIEALAIQRAGGLAALLNWRLAAPELSQLLDAVQPVAVSTDDSLRSLAEAAIGTRAVTPYGIDDPLPGGSLPAFPIDRLVGAAPFVLMHSSGTTGLPKIIPMRNRGFMADAIRLAMWTPELGPGCRASRVGPLFHLATMGQSLAVLFSGGHLFLPDGFEPNGLLDLIESEQLHLIDAAASALRMLVDAARARDEMPNLSSLVEIAYGGSPIEPSLISDLHETFDVRLRQFYGATETCSVVSSLAPEDHHESSGWHQSAGQLALGWEVRLRATDGSLVEIGERPGEVEVRGEAMFEGYWNDPERTAEAMTDDGFYRTGDIGTLSSDGYLTLLDRAKDLIISGGENVYPREVELVLDTHPTIASAAAIGIPSDRWGESVHAVVVSVGEVTRVEETEAEIIAFCRERLAAYKCPVSVSFIDEIPRNASGKILRRQLRTGV